VSAPGLKITNFHYSNVKLPDGPATFQEYPKWVYMEGYPAEIAASAEHEAALLARGTKDALPAAPEPVATPAAPTVTLAPDNDEKSVLLALAKERGIKVDARWKVEKIRAAMTAAQPKAEG
jgi:hypothetical protein